MSEPTPLHVTSALADQASTQGHDAIALRTDAFVVVDGASPLDDANGIAAARLARAVADDLADALPVSSLAAAVASAVQATATLQPEDEVLSAAFAAAWLDGDLMRVAVIGDCVVVRELADGRVEWSLIAG